MGRGGCWGWAAGFRDEDGRVIRFMLQPGQSISEHNAPSSPFYVVVLQGRGMFAGADGVEQSFGPNDLLVFDKGERHATAPGTCDAPGKVRRTKRRLRYLS